LSEISYEKISLRVNQTLAGMRLGNTNIIEQMNDNDGHQVSTDVKTEKSVRNPMIVLAVIDFVADMFSTVNNILGWYSRIKHPNTQDLNDAIVNIQNDLTKIQKDLNEVISRVKVASIQAQYVSSQRVIFESYRIATYYLNMTETKDLTTAVEDVEFWQLEFVKWGSMLRESINFFLDGLLGGGFIGADVLETIAEISNV